MIMWSNLCGFLLLPFMLCSSTLLIEASSDTAGCKPERVHLSYGSLPSTMEVMWETPSLCSPSLVRYAEHPWKLDLSATGVVEDMSSCSLKNCSSLKFVHRVMLKNLSLSSTVYYHPTSGGQSAGPFYFQIPGPEQKEPLQFFIASKSSLSSGKEVFKSLEEVILSEPHAAFFMVNKPSQLLCPVEDNSLVQMRDLTPKLPLMVGPDAESLGEQCAQAAFPRPGHGGPTNTPNRRQWYSMDIGLVHFIVYSAKVLLEKDEKQRKALKAWLLEDLKAADRRRHHIPWVVAISPDPMYCLADQQSDLDCAKNDSRIRHGLEDLFYYFGVDLVLEFQPGIYERTWPHYKMVLVSESYHNPAAPVEVILADGVGGVPVADSSKDAGNETKATPDWSAIRLESTGDSYGHLSVINSTHLYFEWRSASGKDRTEAATVLDNFWLVQEDHGNFSLATLPHNVSDRINQSIRAMGGKPGTFDFISTLTPEPSRNGEGWSKYSIWFGLGCVGAAIFVGLGIVTVRSYLKRRRRRGNSSRRWREVDCQGSGTGHFYSMASSDTDSDGEVDHDFEIDMFERASKSESKLLTSY